MKRFFLLQSLAAVALASIGPVADLHVGNRILAPDGFNRSTVLAGPSSSDLGFPGPLITGTKGDRFKINVINELTDTTMLRSTSIHWHGFFQAGSSWADGPVGVNQCPIAPGNSFLYDFSVPDQAGTFWYHSHYSTQYCDGLRGAFVVRDPNDPHASLYDIDNDNTVITLSDWYHGSAKALSGTFPAEDATLINGLGRYSQGPTTPLAVVKVEKGKRYRFRLVSISCDPFFTFSIDGHDMTIIEADAVSTDPLTVDSLEIYAGQRYSFILNANQPVNNYWIRANSSNGPQGFVGGTNSAILRYAGAHKSDPTSQIGPLSNRLVENNLHALGSTGVAGTHTIGEADVNLNLNIVFTPPNTLTINGAKFVPPSAPVLLQILSGTKSATDLLPSGSVYVLPRNAVVELSIPGGTPGAPHPFHLHGHAFDVVRSAGSDTLNWNNPVRRDVVNTGKLATDNTTIRFTTDNPGPWIFHCHIDWHLEVGLAIVFAEDPDTIQNSTHPAAWDQLCPIYDNLPPDEL